MEQRKVAGMVWYRLEDYDAAMTIMADRANLHRTYAEWRMAAEHGEKKMRRAGWATTRAYIDPATFAAWCGERGLNIDAKARNEFANSVALEAAGNL